MFDVEIQTTVVQAKSYKTLTVTEVKEVNTELKFLNEMNVLEKTLHD